MGRYAEAPDPLPGSRTATTTTDASGPFLFADLPLGGSYTVTPSLRYYVFDSASKTFNNLSADGYAVFIVTPALHAISGRVTESGTALGGVTVTLSGAQTTTATTDAAGNYKFANLWAPGSYTVAASKTHYTFAPPSKTFNGLDADVASDFAATLNRHKISGRASRPDGSALVGATAALSGSQSATATTDSSGNYSL